MDQDEAWLLERYQQSITVAAAMLFGDDEFRFLPISYDDIFCVAGPTPIADAHRSVFRSEERRVGKECVSQCRSRWSPSHSKKKTKKVIKNQQNNINNNT